MPSRSVLSRIAILVALGLAAVAPAAAADLTEAQRQERCANNRARLAEVVRRLAAPDMMSAEEIIRARNEAAWLRRKSLDFEDLRIDDELPDMSEVQAIIARRGLTDPGCKPEQMAACIQSFADQLEQKIRAAEADPSRNDALEQEARNLRTNMTALNCGQSQPEPGPENGINGRWSSNSGEIRFHGADGAVVGEYSHRDGKIHGALGGQVLTGVWTQSWSGRKCDSAQYGSEYWGNLEFTFDAGFTKFTGRYNYCGAEWKDDGWSGSRLD